MQVIRIALSVLIVATLAVPCSAVAIPVNTDGQIFTENGSATIHNTSTYFGMLYCRLGAPTIDFPEFGGPQPWTGFAHQNDDSADLQAFTGFPSVNDDLQVSAFDADVPPLVECRSSACQQDINTGLNNVWFRGYGFGVDVASSGDASGVDYNGGGFLVGVDEWVDDTTLVGVNAGFAASRISLESDTARTDLDSYHVGIHFRRNIEDDEYLIGAAMWGHNEFDSTRRLVGANSSYSGNEFATQLEYGQRMQCQDWLVTPFLSTQYIHGDVDSFTETGGPGSISIDGRDFDSFRGSVGCRLARPIQMSNCRLIVPEFRIQCTHEFIDAERVTGSVPGGGLVLTGSDIGDTFVIYSLGTTIELADRASLFFHYDGQFGHNFSGHTGSGGFLLAW